jgi:hypothetical protein
VVKVWTRSNAFVCSLSYVLTRSVVFGAQIILEITQLLYTCHHVVRGADMAWRATAPNGGYRKLMVPWTSCSAAVRRSALSLCADESSREYLDSRAQRQLRTRRTARHSAMQVMHNTIIRCGWAILLSLSYGVCVWRASEREFTTRYGKQHACEHHMQWLAANPPPFPPHQIVRQTHILSSAVERASLRAGLVVCCAAEQ